MCDGFRISSISKFMHKSAVGQYVVLAVLIAFFIVSCSSSDSSTPSGDDGSTTDPWEVAKGVHISILSPQQDVSYTQFAPPIKIALPSDEQTDASSLEVTLNDHDLGDKVYETDSMASATGYRHLLVEGQNTLVARLGKHSSTVTFRFSGCADTPCPAQEPPVITGPSEAVSLVQTSLQGSGFGSPGDERTLYINGRALPLAEIHSGGDWLIFVAPPQPIDTIDIALEVNGQKSAPFTMKVLPPPELPRPADDILSDFRTGLINLSEYASSLPELDGNDPAYNGMVADLREILGESLDRLFGEYDKLMAGLTVEEQEFIAQTLVQNAIDTKLTQLLQGIGPHSTPMSMASEVGPRKENVACDSSTVSILTIVNYLAMLSDTLKMLQITCLLSTALYPPMAIAAVQIISFLTNQILYIDTIKLYISILLPDLGELTIDLPETVGRHDTVPVHALGAFSYDPIKKTKDVVSFMGSEFFSEVLTTSLGTLLPAEEYTTEALTAYMKLSLESIQQSITTARDFAKYVSEMNQSGEASDPVLTPVEPTLIGFKAEYFRLAKGSAVCEAKGYWDDTTPCSIEDQWRIGWTLGYSGYIAINLNNGKASGTVKTGDGALPLEYDDPIYGALMEDFGAAYGCDAIMECHEVIKKYDDCSPGLAHPLCNSMTLFDCPSEHDVQLSFDRCSGDSGC
jgi:hypothetical protein